MQRWRNDWAEWEWKYGNVGIDHCPILWFVDKLHAWLSFTPLPLILEFTVSLSPSIHIQYNRCGFHSGRGLSEIGECCNSSLLAQDYWIHLWPDEREGKGRREREEIGWYRESREREEREGERERDCIEERDFSCWVNQQFYGPAFSASDNHCCNWWIQSVLFRWWSLDQWGQSNKSDNYIGYAGRSFWASAGEVSAGMYYDANSTLFYDQVCIIISW